MKKGLMVGSDLLYFLLFVLSAALIYLFLFQNLEESIQGKVQEEIIDIDAQFIANTLPYLQTESGNFAMLTDNVIEVYRADSRQLDENAALAAYKLAAEQIFSNEALYTRLRNANGAVVEPEVLGYAVALHDGAKTIDETCIEIPDGNDICKYTDDFDEIAQNGIVDGTQQAGFEGIWSETLQKTTAGTAYLAHPTGAYGIRVFVERDSDE